MNISLHISIQTAILTEDICTAGYIVDINPSFSLISSCSKFGHLQYDFDTCNMFYEFNIRYYQHNTKPNRHIPSRKPSKRIFISLANYRELLYRSATQVIEGSSGNRCCHVHFGINNSALQMTSANCDIRHPQCSNVHTIV